MLVGCSGNNFIIVASASGDFTTCEYRGGFENRMEHILILFASWFCSLASNMPTSLNTKKPVFAGYLGEIVAKLS